YVGNPNAHTLAGQLYLRPLIKALGSTNVYSASTVDQRPKEIASALMFGGALSVPVPDVDRTDFLLMLGAQPHASNGSLATAPPPTRAGTLRLRERGGRPWGVPRPPPAPHRRGGDAAHRHPAGRRRLPAHGAGQRPGGRGPGRPGSRRRLPGRGRRGHRLGRPVHA